MNEEAFIARVKAEQAKYALDSLKNPGNKTEFDFGLRSGYVAGLERAVNVLLEILSEERLEDDPL